jgi:hypothetical protein
MMNIIGENLGLGSPKKKKNYEKHHDEYLKEA